MIVLEGADSGGKTTLAERLHARYPEWLLKKGEGPPTSYTRLNERLAWYASLTQQTICDRHPAISEQIYRGVFVRPWGSSLPTPVQINELYARYPLIIYCRSPSGALTAQGSPTDTQEYVALLIERHERILQDYDHYFRMTPPHVTYDWSNLEAILSWTDCHVRRFSV